MPWVYTGGGTMIGEIGKRFPCDDSYENVVTGENVYLATTQEVHFRPLPRRLSDRDLAKLIKQDGVKLDRRGWWVGNTFTTKKPKM